MVFCLCRWKESGKSNRKEAEERMQSMMMGERWIGETLVRYYLLVEHLPGGKADYGLRLTVPDGDSAELRGITVSASAIRKLLNRLMRCDVTPVSLHDIVEDWLISECHS